MTEQHTQAPLKQRIQHGLIIAAMVTPPWNIFWWTVGSALYKLRGGSKNDRTGQVGLSLVLAAPVLLPMAPYLFVKDELAKRRIRQEEGRNTRFATDITIALQGHGILVEACEGRHDGIRIESLPKDSRQEAEYRNVYAAAVLNGKKLGITAERICGRAHPKHLLDRAWAEEHGLDEWAEETFSDDCADCGVRESLGWQFGEKERHATRNMLGRRRFILRLPDGSDRVVDGHICNGCISETGSTFARVGPIPKD